MTGNTTGIMIWLILFIMGCASVSLAVQLVIDTRMGSSNTKMEYFRRFIFYLFFNYAVLSAIKYMIGIVNGTATQIESLVESFYDLMGLTFIHYGPVFLIMAVALPLCITLLKIPKKYIHIYTTYCTIAIALILIYNGKVDNRHFTWMFIIGAVVSLVINVFYKGEPEYISKAQVKGCIRGIMPVAVCWVFMNGIFIPNELFLNNTVDFTNPYGSFLISLILGAVLILLLIVSISLILLPVKIFRIFQLILFALTLMNYAQYMLLNRQLTIMDGEVRVWSVSTLLINLLIWIAVAALIILTGLRFRKSAGVMNAVCIYIVLIQVVTMGYLTITTQEKPASSARGFTNENALEISEGNNILVFVLDRFDSTFFGTIIEQDPSFEELFADFTFYSDAASPFMHTSTGIPFLLTGMEWQQDMSSESQYIQYAYEKGTVLEDLYDADYNLGIYTESQYVSSDKYHYISNYDESISKRTKTAGTIKTMWNAAFYTTMPYLVKVSYQYYYASIGGMVNSENQWVSSNDLVFYQMLTQEGLSINSSYDNAYRFYHMLGTHSPYILSEDLKYDRKVDVYSQGKGCLKIVYEYIQQLKQLGKYDDATIIITADHGLSMDYGDDYSTIPNTSEALVLIKKANQQQERMNESTLPVTQAGVVAEVMEAAGIKDDKYSQPLDQMNITGKRTCVNSYGFVITYQIDGKVTDLNSWSVESMHIPEE